MNTYFLNPFYFNAERFHILLEILKVKKIIDLTDVENRNQHISNICQSITIYDRKNTEINSAIQQAVYKFNEPMCKAIIDKGKHTGEFLVNCNISLKSYASNPIYNLEECTDDNVLVLIDGNISCGKFIEYSLNILSKYAPYLYSEEKICFIYIDDFLEHSYIYRSFIYRTKIRLYNLKFKRIYINNKSISKMDCSKKLRRGGAHYCDNTCEFHNKKYQRNKYTGSYEYDDVCEIETDVKNNQYDPILSYLNMKSKKLYKNERNNHNIFDFFLTLEGNEARLKRIAKTFYKIATKKRNDDSYMSEESSSYGTNSEYD